MRKGIEIMRELSVEELDLVGGGNNTHSYEVDDGRLWKNTYDANGNFLSTTAIADVGSNAGWFVSGGLSLGYGAWGVGGGFSYGGGDIYAHSGGGYGLPVDLTVGYATDVDAYLTGHGVSWNGLPAGGGLAFDENGNVVASAVTWGLPGGGYSYGVNASDGLSNAVNEVSNGLYQMMGSPYDIGQNYGLQQQ